MLVEEDMIKVMIADDEKYIRNGINDSFHWGAMGMEVVGLAANGKEALEVAKAKKPDICLLDICMPIVSGLEFVEQSKSLLDDPIHIVITGYDDFHYVRQALSLGVYDYILKPIDEDALIALLKKAKAEIERRRQKQRDYMGAISIVEKNKGLIKEELLKKLLEEEGDNTETLDGLARLGIKLVPNMGYIRIFRSKRHGMETAAEKEKQRGSAACLRRALEEKLKCHNSFVTMINGDGSISALYSLENCSTCNEEGCNIVSGVNSVLPKGMGERMEKDRRMLPIVDRIIEYIEENYADTMLQLNTFAEKNGMSAGYLTKLFRQETGDTFVAYLTKFRMRQAARMLDGTDHKIYEIAEMTGYNSQHYFCEIFKNTFGLTPTEYRKRSIAKDEE